MGTRAGVCSGIVGINIFHPQMTQNIGVEKCEFSQVRGFQMLRRLRQEGVIRFLPSMDTLGRCWLKINKGWGQPSVKALGPV